jgi:putative thiamine transport system permease protein
VPHAAAAFGLAFLVAPAGFFFRIVSSLFEWERPPDLLIVQDRLGLAMVLGLALKEMPFLFLMALSALPQTRAAEMERMIAALGYRRIVGFFHAVLPALYRQLRLPVLAVLAFSTSVVDVALILGPTTPAPLAVRVVDWQRDPDLAMHFVAAAGAVLQVGVTGTALLIWLAAERVVGMLCRGLAYAGWRARRDLWLRRVAFAALTLSTATVLLSRSRSGRSPAFGVFRASFPRASRFPPGCGSWKAPTWCFATRFSSPASRASQRPCSPSAHWRVLRAPGFEDRGGRFPLSMCP